MKRGLPAQQRLLDFSISSCGLAWIELFAAAFLRASLLDVDLFQRLDERMVHCQDSLKRTSY